MQGKEASEQETKVKSSVGIDVSKDWLDVHILPCGKRLRMANTADGIRRLKRCLMRFDLGLVVCEATGKWHRLLWRSLFASAIPVAMIDPFKARMFAKAQGIFAKTDRLDAAVLARFAAIMTPAIRPPPPQAVEELAELAAAREAAVAEQTGLKNQLSAANVTSSAASSADASPGSPRTSQRSSARSWRASPPTRASPAVTPSSPRSRASDRRSPQPSSPASPNSAR
jgi:hypothetical protein